LKPELVDLDGPPVGPFPSSHPITKDGRVLLVPTPGHFAILHSRYQLDRWWAQKITILFEHARGLRQKHETQNGYQITVSRTFLFPAGKLFKMWHDKKTRGKWLIDDALTIRTAAANKTLRGSWSNGKTRVEVGFYPKGQSKCQVVVRHTKLGSSADASRTKRFWSEALDRLKNNLDR
jgi:hypothetical protein